MLGDRLTHVPDTYGWWMNGRDDHLSNCIRESNVFEYLVVTYLHPNKVFAEQIQRKFCLDKFYYSSASYMITADSIHSVTFIDIQLMVRLYY